MLDNNFKVHALFSFFRISPVGLAVIYNETHDETKKDQSCNF